MRLSRGNWTALAATCAVLLSATDAALAAGDLRGRVQDVAGAPLRRAVVVVSSLDYELPAYDERTDTDGRFEFPGLPTGRYRISVTLDAHAPLACSVRVSADGALPLTDPPPACAVQAGEILLALAAEPGPVAPPPPPPPEPVVEHAAPTRPDIAPGRVLRLPEDRPLGFAGRSGVRRPRFVAGDVSDFVPIVDRWRLGFPTWERYPGRSGQYPLRRGHWWDPYNQNVLKGDYPVIGQHTFLVFSAISDSLVERRQLPTPSGVAATDPASRSFFGNGNQFFVNQNVILSLDLFHGDTAFRPVDWRIRLTPVVNRSHLRVNENGVVNVDVRRGTRRTDGHAALQEAFAEVKLADLSANYDFLSLRAGIQGFTSDFRGFIFSDNNLGVRLFGSSGANRHQWNLAAFRMREKDTNSGLNTLDARHQTVLVANYFLQDCIWPGYTLSVSLHRNADHAGREDDDGGLHFDDNGFLVRPAPIGDFTQFVAGRENVDVDYFGWAGDGHIGRINLSHAFYEVRGHESHNPIAGQRTTVRSRLAAAEISLDRDWQRYRVSLFWAQGDRDPLDDRAEGFDSILDNNNFAGGGFGFWNRQGVRLTGTGVGLVNRFSLLPDLRSSKDEGQANFVNPGLRLLGLGADFDLTQRVKVVTNLNYLQFDRPEMLELLVFQPDIGRDIGFDASVGVLYRPLLIDNIVLNAGFAALFAREGYRDLNENQRRNFSGFVGLTLAY